MKWDAKMIGAVVSLMSILGGGCTWLYTTGEKTGELKAKVEFQKEHEEILNFNLRCKFICKCE